MGTGYSAGGKKKGIRCFSWLLILFFLSSCSYLASESQKTHQVQEGSLKLYLNFYCPAKEEISLMIKEIQAVRVDGQLTLRPVEQPLKAGPDSRQVLLEINLPTANYQKIGFLFAEASLQRSGASVPLKHLREPVFLSIPFFITPQGIVTSYINLAVSSQREGSSQGPFLAVGLSRGKKIAGLKSLMLYITNTADNTLSILDRLTNSVVEVIQVGQRPKGIVVNPKGTYAYVVNSGSSTVSVIDTMTNELEDTIDLPLAISPTGIAITSDGKYFFTANTGSDNVSLIDTDLKRCIDTLRVGHKPVDVRVSPGGQYLYVTNQGSNDLYVLEIESRQLVDRIPMRSEPAGIAAVSTGQGQDRLFIANSGSSSVFLLDIDLRELKRNVKFSPGHSVKNSSVLQGGYGPTRIVLDKERGRLYVTNQKDNSVSSFSIAGSPSGFQENRYQVGLRPMGLALDAARNYLYVVNNAEDSLSIIDLRQESVVESIKVGRSPFGVDLIRK